MFVAYADILGTRSAAEVNELASEAKMNLFRRSCCLNSRVLKSSGSLVEHYGDGAFIESTSLSELVIFLRLLRKDLFEKGVFFKAGVVKGSLEVSSFRSHIKSATTPARRRAALKEWGIEILEADEVAVVENVFNSVYFKSAAIDAYNLQSGFKGLGIALDAEVGVKVASGTMVRSRFIADRKGAQVVPYMDLRLTPDDLVGFSDVVLALRNVKIANPEYSRYYVSHSVTAIRSLNLKSLTLEAKMPSEDPDAVAQSKPIRWIDLPISGWDAPETVEEQLFDYFFMSDRYLEDFSGVPGYLIPIAAFIEELYRQRDVEGRHSSESANIDGCVSAVIGAINRKRGLVEKLARLPATAFEPTIRAHYVMLHVSYTDLIKKTFRIRGR